MHVYAQLLLFVQSLVQPILRLTRGYIGFCIQLKNYVIFQMTI